MQTIDQISNVLLYFVPAFLVMIILFWVMRRNAERERQDRLLELRKHLQKETLQFRLQAYERLILFLERISPNSILPRLHRPGMSGSQLHTELLVTIRTEFEHNFSQQLYVSRQGWEEVVSAKDQMVRIINECSRSVGDKAGSIQLSSRIVEYFVAAGELPTLKVVEFLKKEARQLFG